jgi:hypothetical protein
MSRLSFYARRTALVADPHAQERGVRRFIGRRWQEVTTGRWSWVPSGKPQETDYHHDLVKACKDGDLWAATPETATACGVPFDPDFGGEFTESIKAFKAKVAPAAEVADDKAKAGSKPGGKGEV